MVSKHPVLLKLSGKNLGIRFTKLSGPSGCMQGLRDCTAPPGVTEPGVGAGSMGGGPSAEGIYKL